MTELNMEALCVTNGDLNDSDEVTTNCADSEKCTHTQNNKVIHADVDQLEISLDKPSEVCKLVTEGGQLTTTRQKAINLADRSKDEWSALHVYESDELACQKMQRELTVSRKEEGGFGP
ncbi:hypothetical protein ACROYT_G030014 [Oculina patagonica]